MGPTTTLRPHATLIHVSTLQRTNHPTEWYSMLSDSARLRGIDPGTNICQRHDLRISGRTPLVRQPSKVLLRTLISITKERVSERILNVRYLVPAAYSQRLERKVKGDIWVATQVDNDTSHSSACHKAEEFQLLV